MSNQIENLIKNTNPDDRLSIIAQYRHNQPLYCIAETRIQTFDDHNHLCDVWGYPHCKMEETVSIEIDREYVALAKSHGMETTDYDFEELLRKSAKAADVFQALGFKKYTSIYLANSDFEKLRESNKTWDIWPKTSPYHSQFNSLHGALIG